MIPWLQPHAVVGLAGESGHGVSGDCLHFAHCIFLTGRKKECRQAGQLPDGISFGRTSFGQLEGTSHDVLVTCHVCSLTIWTIHAIIFLMGRKLSFVLSFVIYSESRPQSGAVQLGYDRLLSFHSDCSVEANHRAVEHRILHDLLGQQRVLRRLSKSCWKDGL